MKGRALGRAARWFSLSGATGLVCLVFLGALWSFEGNEKSTTVTFRPTPLKKGAAASFPRGDALLFQLLQSLADVTGQAVCLAEDAPPTTAISVSRALTALDMASAKEVLEAAGYDLTEESYKGKQVYWVQKPLSAVRKKGKILHGGEKPEGPEGVNPPSEPQAQRGAASLSSYERQEGGGARFVVIFETDSREDATEAVIVLRAHQRAKARGK